MNQNDKALKVFSYYWKHLKSYPHFVAGIIFSLPITVLLNSYLPALVLADVLSRLSQHDYVAHDIWASFGSQIIIYLSLILAGMLMWRMVDFFTWRLEGNITEDMAEEVLDHMLNQSTDFHANNFTGSLVNRGLHPSSRHNNIPGLYAGCRHYYCSRDHGLPRTTICHYARGFLSILHFHGF